MVADLVSTWDEAPQDKASHLDSTNNHNSVDADGTNLTQSLQREVDKRNKQIFSPFEVKGMVVIDVSNKEIKAISRGGSAGSRSQDNSQPPSPNPNMDVYGDPIPNPDLDGCASGSLSQNRYNPPPSDNNDTDNRL